MIDGMGSSVKFKVVQNLIDSTKNLLDLHSSPKTLYLFIVILILKSG